jgi:hypothetical protein
MIRRAWIYSARWLMLRRARNVFRPTPVAAWLTSGLSTGAISIRLSGVDPRLLLVPRLWVERPGGTTPDNPTGVTWSLYSAGEDSRGGTVPLRVVEGANARPIGPTMSAGADGTVQAGDNIEIDAATDLLVVARCAAVGPNTIRGQTLWFALDAYPAETSLSPEDYDGLLADVRAQCPPVLEIAG